MRTLSILLLIGALAASSQGQPITFAWLSDTHVGSATGADDLRRSVRDINGRTDITFVLISGDITESGTDAELSLARSILDSLRSPCHIIPGNHDTKWSESGGTTFRRIWRSDRFDFREGPYRFIGMHEGPRMRMADGHWAPEDVRWLDSVCHGLQPGESVFFVTHYPLDSSIANWYVVLDRLKALPVQMILVGHGHRNRVEDFEGLPGAMGRSNLRDREGFAGYTIGRITADSCVLFERRPETADERRWHGVPLLRGKRALPGGPWPRPSYSVNDEYPDVRSVWDFPTGFTIAAGAALLDTLVVSADASGTIRCLGLASGKEQWKYVVGGPVFSTPAAGDGRVVVGSVDSSIVCLDAPGTLAWRQNAGSPVLGSPAISGGKVFVGNGRGMQAYDLRTGRRLWESQVTNGFVECRPLVIDGRVIFGAWDGHLYALDESDGHVLWTWQGGSPGKLYSPAACWPVAAGGRVFIVAPDRKMTAIDIETGETIWRSGSHEVRESIGISGDAGKIFVRLMRDTIMAFRPDSVPSIVWSTVAGFGYDINSAMLVEKGGTLFYGTKNGLILALDEGTGAVLWKHRVGPGLVNTLQPVDNSSVICTDFDGNIRYVKGPRHIKN